MSGISGIFNLDRSPVDGELLHRMTELISHRGPDGTGYWSSGAVGFAHQRLCTTPESLREKQPLLNESGILCITFDGRVDNCGELRAALRSNGACLRDDTDAELVLKAYEAWGENSPARILGDFAYAVWDGCNRRLFCARDILGLKPFYYFTDDRRFLFGSELRQLHAYKDLPRKVNEGMLAEYLANQVTSREETFWQKIMRLPPAHFMVIEPGRPSRIASYWDVDCSRQIRYKADQEYAGHFLDIFKEAVRCRMRSHRPVGAELSGGLDSSSAVCIGEWLRQQSRVSVPGFETFSLLFPGRDCDESSYIESVVGKWRLKWHSIGEEVPGIPWYRAQVARYFDCTDYPNGAMEFPMFRASAKRQVRVLLNGNGGDHWFEGQRRWARPGGISALQTQLSLLFTTAKDQGLASAVEFAANRGRKLLIHAVSSRRVGASQVPYWITTELARRTALRDRINMPRSGPESDPARPRLSIRPHLGILSHINEILERGHASHALEGRSPFFDRRLIEFACGVPEDQLRRGTMTKVVLRQGMAPFLPERVRLRSTKAEFGHTFAQGLAHPEAKAVFCSLSIGERRWVKPEVALQLYNRLVRAFSQGKPLENIWPTWMILGAELWVRQFQN